MLQRIHDACEEIARSELGLDVYPNQIEVITAEQMLDAYSSVGMPLFYKHWSFGKHFAYHEASYRKGPHGPCLRDRDQQFAVHFLPDGRKYRDHAGAGDRARGVRPQPFFQEQLSLQAMDGRRRHSRLSRIREELCRPMRGASWPASGGADARRRARLDVARIDRYPGKKKLDLRAEEKRAGKRRLHEEGAFNDLWRTIPTGPVKSEALLNVERRRKLLGLPQENLLYFLEKTAPRLQPWQRELLRIVRLSRSIFIRRARQK